MLVRAIGGVLLVAAVLHADVSSVRRGFDPLRTSLVKMLGGKGHTYYCCAFSPDGKYLAAGTLQGPIHLFDARTWDKLSEFGGHAGGVWTLAFGPNGKTIATGGQDGQVKLWDVAGMKEIRQVGSHQAMVWGISFSSDGTRLATSAMDGTTKIFDPETGEEKVAIQGTHPNSRPVIFTPDGSQLVCSAIDGSIKVFDVKDGSEKKSIDTGNQPLMVAVLARDGRTLYGGGQTGSLRVFDVSSGKETAELIPSARGQQILSLALTPDGKYLISAESRHVRIYDTKSHKRLASLAGHRSSIYSVAVSPDGRWIASASAEGALNVWGYKPGMSVGAAPKGRGYLGVTVQTPAAGQGCEIQQVLAGTAADKSGLQPGDKILKVGKSEINTYEEAVQAIGSNKEGDEVEFLIERDGKEQKIKIKLGAHPDDQLPQDE